MPASRRSFRTRIIGALIAIGAIAASGCGRTEEPLTLKPEERVLLARLTRDPFIQVTDLHRNDDEQLEVTTRQGDAIARYLFAPDDPAMKELKIRRIVEQFELKTAPSDPPPEPRGLAH
ncbi:MAG: hypothetical protein H0W83_10555 [Planctomycetes bacterium]|nr:hypothetical protein [Planctomycetota bacterium]